MVDIKKLKVGQKFVECYPTRIWFRNYVNVDIAYGELVEPFYVLKEVI